MEAIPDTGGGVAGFLAHLLWHVYRYFPFSGTWDWLVLVALLAFGLRVANLPFLARLLTWDVRTNRAAGGRWTRDRIFVGWCWAFWVGWSLVCFIALLRFFDTRAGQTFLAGRAWFGSLGPGQVLRASINDDRPVFLCVLVLQAVFLLLSLVLLAEFVAAHWWMRRGAKRASSAVRGGDIDNIEYWAFGFVSRGVFEEYRGRLAGGTAGPNCTFECALLIAAMFIWGSSMGVKPVDAILLASFSLSLVITQVATVAILLTQAKSLPK